MVPSLSDTYRVVVPDHIGCGLSSKPQDYTYTLEQHIANLEALIGHLGLRQIVLVVHDWGGAIGMGFATRHPEAVDRFVIFNTSAFYMPAVPWVLKVARSPVLGALMLRGLNAFAGLAVWLAVENRERMSARRAVGLPGPLRQLARPDCHLSLRSGHPGHSGSPDASNGGRH